MQRRLAWFAALLMLLPPPLADGGQFDLLAAGILAKYRLPQPTPGPTPPPAPKPPAGECERCSGTGKLGDGTVFVICPACKGSGRITTPPATLPTPQAIQPPVRQVPIPPPAAGRAGLFRGRDGRLWMQDCGPSGCRLVPVE